MTGRLHQVHVEYEPAEDRILLKFNTMDRQELRLWLTRKFVKSFWDRLQKLLESMGRAGALSDPELRKATVALDQERAAPSERFARKFADEAESFPLGREPVLVTGFSYTPARRATPAGRAGAGRGAPAQADHGRTDQGRTYQGRIAFETASGHEVGLPADATLLHSLSKMLIGINDRTGWDLRLDAGYPLGEQPQRPARMH